MHGERYGLEFDERTLACALFEVENARGVVLFGHGLGVSCHDDTVVRPARLLNEQGFIVFAPELPLHGERGGSGTDWQEVVSSWAAFWAGDGRNQLVDEWLHVLAHVEKNTIYLFFILACRWGHNTVCCSLRKSLVLLRVCLACLAANRALSLK